MHQNDLEDATPKVRRSSTGKPGFEETYRPVFAKRGGHGVVAVHHDPDVGSHLAYFPHDKTKRPMLWTIADNEDGSNIDVMSSVAPSGLNPRGGWHTFHGEDDPDDPSVKKRPFLHSSPSILKEVGGIVKIHHPDRPLTGRRVTGMSSPDAPTRGFDFSRLSAEDVERYYNEVYGGLRS
jgi:hypothetical protein